MTFLALVWVVLKECLASAGESLAALVASYKAEVFTVLLLATALTFAPSKFYALVVCLLCVCVGYAGYKMGETEGSIRGPVKPA